MTLTPLTPREAFSSLTTMHRERKTAPQADFTISRDVYPGGGGRCRLTVLSVDSVRGRAAESGGGMSGYVLAA
jgi:hypothetical protein